MKLIAISLFLFSSNALAHWNEYNDYSEYRYREREEQIRERRRELRREHHQLRYEQRQLEREEYLYRQCMYYDRCRIIQRDY